MSESQDATSLQGCASPGAPSESRPPELRLSDEMIERAARAWAPTVFDLPVGAQERKDARRDAALALRAAFEGVPLTNFGIGLSLQFFDLVICVKDGVGAGAAAGVYRRNEDVDGFDSLGHTLEVQWGHKPSRYLKRVAVSQVDAPTALDGSGR